MLAQGLPPHFTAVTLKNTDRLTHVVVLVLMSVHHIQSYSNVVGWYGMLEDVQVMHSVDGRYCSVGAKTEVFLIIIVIFTFLIQKCFVIIQISLKLLALLLVLIGLSSLP